ncbi:DHBP synthase RibB-like alpha/beta domain-containing protein [Umbelopsis sp. PMI_123]|nr:DHBP synthase RibB-like alpha/beta domain-containing protein [Umbelopsis sp. PMI_123]
MLWSLRLKAPLTKLATAFSKSYSYIPMLTKIESVRPQNITFQAGQSDKPPLYDPRSNFSVASEEAAVMEAVKLLAEDEVIGMPTETVYGLAANALSEVGISKIYSVKNRPQDNPLIVHVSSLSMLESIMPDNRIPPIYLPLLEKMWPGALTIIVPKADIIPSAITCGQPTVAIRFPSHPVARALIERCGFPLAAPSANSSGKPSPTLASHVMDDLNKRIPLILDGGQCDFGVESTVLDGLRNPPAILRPGGCTYEDIHKLPGMEKLQVYRKDFVDKQLEMVPTTPGMKYRHYSPEAAVVLFEHPMGNSNGRNIASAIRNEVHKLTEAGQQNIKIGVLHTSDNFQEVHGGSVQIISQQMGRASHPEEVAKAMFVGIRDLDSQGVDYIFIEGISEDREGMAVMNRLRKAASTIIQL